MDAPALLLLSDIVKSLMPLVGIMLVVTALMMMLRNKRRSNAQRLTPIEQVERYQQERGMRQDLESLMVEIEQLARRFSSQLDAKSVQLERLLQEADEKITQLQHASTATQSPPPAPPPTQPQPAPAQASNNVEDELSRQVYQLADQGLTSDQIARQLDELVGKVELILALRK